VSVYPYKARPVSELIPYARNARTHSDGQVAQIAASIREFGFINPVIIDGQGGIVAGHGRVMAARKLGLVEVPTLEVSHLTDAQRKAYILADNKLALNAGWDVDLLKVELTELGDAKFDLELTGFSIGELSAMFDDVNFAPGTEGDQGRLDQLAPKMVQCPHCGDEFDLREHGQS
jgi:ParB-like chromosome segregation protein Spo0J